MRVNVYSQEITSEIQTVTKPGTDKDGHITAFHAVRLYLHSSPMLHHNRLDDDRSAVTFWLPKSPDRIARMARTFHELAELIEGYIQ
jgi:hypothetical protein